MTLKLSAQVILLLEQLTATGFYGSTPAGTAQALIDSTEPTPGEGSNNTQNQ